jgi:hypothetical protein
MTRELAPRNVALVAYGLGLAAGFALLVSFGFVEIWLKGLPGSDFSVIWAGPRILIAGGDPYDALTFRAASAALSAQPSATDVYIYPGWVAVLLAPLGALDLPAANVVWTVVGLALAAGGLYALLASGPPVPPLAHTAFGFTLIASESAIVAFYSGQTDFVIVGGLALMCAWLRQGRSMAAGISGGAMLLKPHLVALALPALAVIAIARGDRRFVYALLGTAIALAGLSTVVVPQWWEAWLAHVPAARASDLRASTLPNALRDIFGAPGALGGYALLAAAVLAALSFGRTRAAVPVWLAVSISVTPYLFVYDHVVGIVPLAMAVLLIAERDTRLALAAALAGALILFPVAVLLHAFPGVRYGTLSYNGLAQFALTALVVGSLWPLRRSA